MINPIGKSFVFIFFVLFSQLAGSAANAEYVEPALVKVSTARPESSRLVFHPGTYKYKISWQGIPVASSEIILGDAPLLSTESGPEPGMVAVRATARSSKGIDLLYKLRHTSESLFNLNTLAPQRFLTEQTENSRYKRLDVRFQEGTNVLTKLWKSKDSAEPSETLEFISNNFTVDPLFGAVLARSLPIAIGSEASFDVWNGKNRYLITFKVDAKENVHIRGKELPAYRVTPKVIKLTDSEGEKRLRSCTLWVSADERRDILKVESAVLIGKVTAVLETVINPVTPELIEAKAPAAEDSARGRLKQD